MNEKYAVAMAETADLELVEHNNAFDRLSLLFDVIDFDNFKRICDIGTRFLEQTMEMAHIFPEAEFHSFEPVPGSYQICLNNRSKCPKSVADRISIYEMALNNETKEIPFYPVNNTGSEFNVGASSKYRFVPGLNGSWWNKTWNQDEITVKSMRMDDWRQANGVGPIDLIWMDAQGSELDVLKGAVDTLRDVKVILTEVGVDSYYQGQSLKPQIDEFIMAQGFVELPNSFKLNFQYEGDVIYIKESLL
jgi:FkbM family methyltransferase